MKFRKGTITLGPTEYLSYALGNVENTLLGGLTPELIGVRASGPSGKS